MFTTHADLIAMNLGYAVEFLGGVFVAALAVMFVHDVILRCWNRRVHARAVKQVLAEIRS